MAHTKRQKTVSVPLETLLEWQRIVDNPIQFARDQKAFAERQEDPLFAEHLARCYALGWLQSAIKLCVPRSE